MPSRFEIEASNEIERTESLGNETSRSVLFVGGMVEGKEPNARSGSLSMLPMRGRRQRSKASDRPSYRAASIGSGLGARAIEPHDALPGLSWDHARQCERNDPRAIDADQSGRVPDRVGVGMMADRSARRSRSIIDRSKIEKKEKIDQSAQNERIGARGSDGRGRGRKTTSRRERPALALFSTVVPNFRHARTREGAGEGVRHG